VVTAVEFCDTVLLIIVIHIKDAPPINIVASFYLDVRSAHW